MRRSLFHVFELRTNQAGRFDRIGRFEFDGVSTGLWGDAEKGKVGDVVRMVPKKSRVEC